MLVHYSIVVLLLVSIKLSVQDALNPADSTIGNLDAQMEFRACTGRDCDDYNRAVRVANQHRSDSTQPAFKFGARLKKDIVLKDDGNSFVFDKENTRAWLLNTIKLFRCEKLKDIDQSHYQQKNQWNDKIVDLLAEVKMRRHGQSITLDRMYEIFNELHGINADAERYQDASTDVSYQCSDNSRCSKDGQKSDMQKALLEMRLTYACSGVSRGGEEKLEVAVVMLSNESHAISGSINTAENYAAIARSARAAQTQFEEAEQARLNNNRAVLAGQAVMNGLSLAALAIPVPGLNLAMSLMFGMASGFLGLLSQDSEQDIGKIYRDAIKNNLNAAEQAQLARELEGALTIVMRSNAAVVALANDDDQTGLELFLMQSSLDVEKPYAVIGSFMSHVSNKMTSASSRSELNNLASDIKMYMDYIAIVKSVNSMASSLIPDTNREFDTLKRLVNMRIDNIQNYEDRMLKELAKMRNDRQNPFNTLEGVPIMEPYITAATNRGLMDEASRIKREL